MACNCGSTCCGDGMLAGLMGQIEDYPVWPGAYVQFGFNEGIVSYPTASRSDLAQWMEEEGLLYSAISDRLTGWLNIFTTIEGYAIGYWDSQRDLCEEIRSVIKGRGYPIDDFSVKCNVQRQTDVGETVVMQPGIQPPGSSGGGNVPRSPSGDCDGLNAPDWVACKLGVTTTSAVVIGAVVGIGALLLIKRS